MKKIEFISVILLFVGTVFAQDQVNSQTEELNITQIKEKAKADAKFDFRKLGWIKWGAGSLLMSWGGLVGEFPGVIIGLVGPSIIASFTPINVPPHREEELSSQTNELKEIYRLMYQDTFKKQRLKYTMLGPSSCLVVVLYFTINEEAASALATCFAPGTDIIMADGLLKRIEDIEVGDMILSYNFETKQTEADEVLELYSTTNDNMMEMKFSDGIVIRSTFDHPYYVKDKGWSSLKPEVTKELITNINEVGQLEEGDICYILKDGELTEVEFLGSQRLNTFQRTYTIKKLKKNNAFFAEGVLVGVETVKDIENINLKSHLNRFYSKYNKSITELLAGASGAVLLGAIGLNIIEDSLPGESLESAFGMTVGIELGSIIGVWLAGERVKDNGTLIGAFLGAVACPTLFLLVDASLGFPMYGYSLFLGSFFSPLGATIGYALSRPEKPPQTGSQLNIDENTERLEIPSPTIRLSGNNVIKEYQNNMIKSQF